jgi:dihydrofolate reductase
VQAPAYAGEDPDGGFAHGGWHTPYFDDLSRNWVASSISAARAFLFGRRTYQIFAAHWPRAADAEQPLAEPLNTRPKYVASTTLSQPLEWANSILLNDDVTGALRALKHQDGPDVHLIGSAQLAQTLLAHDLIDQMRLMIDPLLLGAGKRFFPASNTPTQLRLTDSQVTTTGAILATYTRTP